MSRVRLAPRAAAVLLVTLGFMSWPGARAAEAISARHDRILLGTLGGSDDAARVIDDEGCDH
jgi:hypothetical protein